MRILEKGKTTWDKWGFGIVSEGEDNENNIHFYGFSMFVFFTLKHSLLKPVIGRYDRKFYKEYSIQLSSLDGPGTEYNIFIYYGVPEAADHSESFWGGCKIITIPWTSWRFYSEEYLSENRDTRAINFNNGIDINNEFEEYKKPIKVFLCKDYDNTEVTVKCNITRITHLRGDGLFKWVSKFTKPRIITSMSMEFSEPIGKQKHSWKGGTVGTGICMTDSESMEDAMKRFCEINELTFIKEFKITKE